MNSGEWLVKRSGTGERLMTRLHFVRDCAETDKMLNGSIKQLFTIH